MSGRYEMLSTMATVVGAIIGGLVALAGIAIKAHLDRAADHQKWLLDKGTGLYEDVLMIVAAWESRRDQAMRVYRTSEPDAEIPMPDDAARRRIQVRLSMFADSDVRDAFDRYTDARAQWSGSHGRLTDVQEMNNRIAHGQEPPGTEPVTGEHLAKLKTERENTGHHAQNRADELTQLINAVVQRSPRSRRWLPVRIGWPGRATKSNQS